MRLNFAKRGRAMSRQRRIKKAVNTLLEEISESDPPVDERIRELAEEHDLTEEEIRRAWKNTVD